MMRDSFTTGFFDELLKIAEGETEEAPPECESLPEVPSEPGDTIGDLASSESRRRLSELLGSTEGREEIRKDLDRLRDQANELITKRRALTRGLLRARREIYGPSPTPRNDLRDLLYGGEPYWAARFAR